MLPFLQVEAWHPLGAVAIQPFGLLVVLGVLLGRWLVQRRAREAGIPGQEIGEVIAAAVVPGFVAAHLVEVLVNHPGRLAQEGPLALARVWTGLDSFGGFAGALAGMTLYFWRSGRPWLRVADLIVQGLVVGWIPGRLGCALVHDHPGRPSTALLAVRFPGGPRHDLGLEECLFTLLVLLPLIRLLHRSRRLGARPGVYVACVSAAYAAGRFGLDFLRADDLPGADRRWLGLTSAQYGCIALLGVAAAVGARLAPRWHGWPARPVPSLQKQRGRRASSGAAPHTSQP